MVKKSAIRRVNAIDPADPSQTTCDLSGYFRNIFPSPTIGLQTMLAVLALKFFLVVQAVDKVNK